MALEGTLGVKDIANQIYALSAQKDAEIQSLLDRIDQATEALAQDGTNDYKYRVLTSTEYLFARLRVVVEFEAIKCKQLLNDSNTPPVLKTFFTKRSVVLAEIGSKLNAIREDLNVLQRFQYSLNFKQQ